MMETGPSSTSFSITGWAPNHDVDKEEDATEVGQSETVPLPYPPLKSTQIQRNISHHRYFSSTSKPDLNRNNDCFKSGFERLLDLKEMPAEGVRDGGHKNRLNRRRGTVARWDRGIPAKENEERQQWMVAAEGGGADRESDMRERERGDGLVRETRNRWKGKGDWCLKLQKCPCHMEWVHRVYGIWVCLHIISLNYICTGSRSRK